jgi:hypothetical protein
MTEIKVSLGYAARSCFKEEKEKKKEFREKDKYCGFKNEQFWVGVVTQEEEHLLSKHKAKFKPQYSHNK